jgi:hypothetical protein
MAYTCALLDAGTLNSQQLYDSYDKVWSLTLVEHD